MVRVSRQLPSYVDLCQLSPIGKHLPDALYVHFSALGALSPVLQALEQRARKVTPLATTATLIKFCYRKAQIVYLFYPEFDTEAHPALQCSLQICLETLTATARDYSRTHNPPVLHRKETFVTPDYPHYDRFAWLTQQEVILGLLSEVRGIGCRQAWEQRLRDRALVIEDHALACPLPTGMPPAQAKPNIQRHKAAIARVTPSKPVRLAVEAGLFLPDATYFDYGCGYGTDIQYIQQLGLTAAGWDPYYRPDQPCICADIVNLGYVINVIEETAERRQALMQAWALTTKVLIVAAQVLVDDRTRGVVAYGDGIITRRHTFQKYYQQEELKAYIDQVLGVDAIPVALGIYFVFRDEAQAESFRARRCRSRATAPRIRLSVNRFEQYRQQLQPLMDFYTERGRLPTPEELTTDVRAHGCTPLLETFGSIKRAFKVILQATDANSWEKIADKRRHDLLVYLALSHFSKRPKLKDLPAGLRADIKALFGSYQQACTAADLMLMSLGRMTLVAERGRQSPIGQQRPRSLWVHVSALDQLDPLLRLYEGCAARTIGRPEEATIVKFHLQKPQITYWICPDFDRVPHPALHTSMVIHLQDLQVRYCDYDQKNPPLLHQKEQLVTADYPGYAKFARLSQQERRWGVLADMTTIVDRHGWERCLAAHQAVLRGHRLVRRQPESPQ